MEGDELAIRQRLKTDFPHYAEKCLRIRTKTKGIKPFILNKAQRYIHERMEAQLAQTGMVRCLILKGRQQGCSTLVSGRFYWRVSHSFGVRCFILTHETDATDNLFGMVERYHEHCPDLVKPKTGAANAKELVFSVLDSGYAVGTARTKAVGRSQTIQLFHGSEVAFWPNAHEHAAGVIQTIPDAEGTEIVLESTANGVGGYFHEQWQMAERGEGAYIAIFVPWYWQDEYRRTPPTDFQLTPEEQDYAAAYKLDAEQMAWRRAKIVELKDSLLFKQEYPANAAEAFQLTGHDSFIPSDLVVKARKAEVTDPIGPLVIGADPSRFGDDSFAIARRRGRKVFPVERHYKLDTMAGAGLLKRIIETENPAKMFIDVGGLGAGVYDRLAEMGFEHIVVPVNFGGAPLEPPLVEGGGPKNRRAEMWMNVKDWLSNDAQADLPDDDDLQADLCGPGYKYDSESRVLLERKEDMRARGVASPDAGDAVALTFAEPVTVARFPVASAPMGAGGWMG